jgi:hypothetical protein
MSWTNKGYSCSVIFSLLANSRARSKGILRRVSVMDAKVEKLDSPHTLEVHWADLNDVARLLTLQDTVPSTPRHSCYIQKLGSVDHVIIWTWSALQSIWVWDGLHSPSRRATHTPLASTWKQRLPSSSQSVAVTRGFIPGGAT